MAGVVVQMSADDKLKKSIRGNKAARLRLDHDPGVWARGKGPLLGM